VSGESGQGDGWGGDRVIGNVAGTVNDTRRQGTTDRYIGCDLREGG
jgi:hypothetical protein